MSNIATALVKAQSEMSLAVKDSKNPFFKSMYADLNSVREAVLPSLNKNGVVVLQPIVQIENRSFVRTTLMHVSGESVTSDTEVVCAKQNDPQAYGSAISYARRYGLQSLMCVGAEDNDAEKAMSRDTVKPLTGSGSKVASNDNLPTAAPSFKSFRKETPPSGDLI